MVATVLVAAFSSSTSNAQRSKPFVSDKPNPGVFGERVNSNTIAVVSGNLNATYLTIAYDLSAVLDDGDNLRILPVMGKGGAQNIRDVRYLKGVDLGITQSILLNTFRKNNELGPIDDKIVYIAKLFNEEMHIVVRADSGINSIAQLAGKRVNFSDVGSGTQLSTRDIFARLGIKAEEVNIGQADGLEQLKAGKIAATVLIAGKPAAAMTKLQTQDGFRFLPIPYARQLHDEYLPATLTHADYPDMVAGADGVDTVAVGAALVAYNWPRWTDNYRRLEKFTEQFFSKIAEFQKSPRHPKWREVNLAATLPGWKRFAAAEEWLAKNAPPPVAATRDKFDAFLSTRGNTSVAIASSADRERLFEDFQKWNRSREHR